MTVADNLRKICAAARPAIEAALDAADELSEIREAASEQGLDWSQVKALLKAQIQDERDGGGRVKKLVDKADNAATYAAMLDMTSENVAEKRKTTPQSKPQLAASAGPPAPRGDEAALARTGAASPISEAAPALGGVGGKGADAASSHSAATTSHSSSLGGGNLAGTETSGHSLSETDAVSRKPSDEHSIVEPADLKVSTPRGEIEPVSDLGLAAGSPIPDTDGSRGSVESKAVRDWSRRPPEHASRSIPPSDGLSGDTGRKYALAGIAQAVKSAEPTAMDNRRIPEQPEAAHGTDGQVVGVAPDPRETDPDPSLDIRNQPFYRGGETWPR